MVGILPPLPFTLVPMSSTTSRTHRLLPLVASALAVGLTLSACSSSETTNANNTNTAATAATTGASASTASASDATTTRATVQATAEAARAFLSTLSEEQRSTVLRDYEDEDKSVTWSNFPVTFVERAG